MTKFNAKPKILNPSKVFVATPLLPNSNDSTEGHIYTFACILTVTVLWEGKLAIHPPN